MIGGIAETDHGPVFQRRGRMQNGIECFLAGYREAAGLVGMGVRVLPVIIAGPWPFPHTMGASETRRCLVGLGDGSGNDALYHSVMRFYPALSCHGGEIVLSFIPIVALHGAAAPEMLDIGRLAACFDLAAWAVDSLPGQETAGLYALTSREVRALSLGIWANILLTWLYGMDILPCRTLQEMRLAICGIVMEKLALLGGGRVEGDHGPCMSPSRPAASVVEGYMSAYPGMMGRIADMLSCCSEAFILQPSLCPEAMCEEVVNRSLQFFQNNHNQA